MLSYSLVMPASVETSVAYTKREGLRKAVKRGSSYKADGKDHYITSPLHLFHFPSAYLQRVKSHISVYPQCPTIHCQSESARTPAATSPLLQVVGRHLEWSRRTNWRLAGKSKPRSTRLWLLTRHGSRRLRQVSESTNSTLKSWQSDSPVLTSDSAGSWKGEAV